MKRLSFIGIWICLMVLTGSPAAADPTGIRVGMSQWPPWKIVHTDGFGGIDVEIRYTDQRGGTDQ